MTTRTSQPAGGALLISEMKEFAGFPKATQRYIRRSLDVAYGRSDPIETWARDEVEAAAIRAQARFYKQLDHLAHADPGRQRPRHDRAVPRHAGNARRVRPRPGPHPRISPPSASSTSGCSARVRPWLPAAFCAAAALPHLHPDRRRCCSSRSAKARRPRRAGRPASRCSGPSGSRRRRGYFGFLYVWCPFVADRARSGRRRASPAGAIDRFGEPVRAARAVDRAALVDRVGQVQPVAVAHAVGEGLGQLLAHLGERAVAVRLEHDQQPPGLRGQRRQRRLDLVGVVREIVDHGHAAAVPTVLEPPLEALEQPERGDRILERHAERVERRKRGERVRGIVAAGDGEATSMPLSPASRSKLKPSGSSSRLRP